jgi:SRSO17 transposase
MTPEQVVALGPAFGEYLAAFRPCFLTKPTFTHFQTYCRGLISDLPRKSVEPIALEGGSAVRTLQEFLTFHHWDQSKMRDDLQRRVAREHLPVLGTKAPDGLGVIGIIDETSVPKKGDKTPGVQRQHCGASGKTDNCIVTVHLALSCGSFRTMIDGDLYLPEHTWHEDRDRCRQAHIPDEVVYRPKWQIAIEQVKRALGNGIRLDWVTFDEDYGDKPQFLYDLDALGVLYVGEVKPKCRCWPTHPPPYRPGRRGQRPFVAKRVDNAVIWGKPFVKQKWKRFKLDHQTTGPQTWEVRAAQVWLQKDGRHTDVTCRPTDRTYWLIVARNVKTKEVKYFVSNAPPRTALRTLLRVGFSRWGVEHVIRVAKSEVGFDHFEGRSYLGLMRHMTLCLVVLSFVAAHTTRLRGKKSRPVGADHGADRPRAQRGLPRLAPAPPQGIRGRAGRIGHPVPPATKPGRPPLAAAPVAAQRVAL